MLGICRLDATSLHLVTNGLKPSLAKNYSIATKGVLKNGAMSKYRLKKRTQTISHVEKALYKHGLQFLDCRGVGDTVDRWFGRSNAENLPRERAPERKQWEREKERKGS
jgi:hypothetical protein